jgi:hypothetical protein
MSRIDRDRMILLALAVVAEAHRAAHQGPVARTNALRLALTYLHSCSDGDRRAYDVFWIECANMHSSLNNEAQANNMRATWLNPAWHGILRSLRIDGSIEFGKRLSKIREREWAEFETIYGKAAPKI